MEEMKISEVIQEEPYAKVYLYGEMKLMFIEWGHKVTFNEYQQTFKNALAYGKDNREKVKLFLSDISKRNIVSPEERKWFEEVALPEAVNYGLERGAVVFDGNPFKKYYLNNIYMRTKMYKLPYKFFTSKEKAIGWLKSYI